jgi:hypothetical protein
MPSQTSITSAGHGGYQDHSVRALLGTRRWRSEKATKMAAKIHSGCFLRAYDPTSCAVVADPKQDVKGGTLVCPLWHDQFAVSTQFWIASLERRQPYRSKPSWRLTIAVEMNPGPRRDPMVTRTHPLGSRTAFEKYLKTTPRHADRSPNS